DGLTRDGHVLLVVDVVELPTGRHRAPERKLCLAIVAADRHSMRLYQPRKAFHGLPDVPAQKIEAEGIYRMNLSLALHSRAKPRQFHSFVDPDAQHGIARFNLDVLLVLGLRENRTNVVLPNVQRGALECGRVGSPALLVFEFALDELRNAPE